VLHVDPEARAISASAELGATMGGDGVRLPRRASMIRSLILAGLATVAAACAASAPADLAGALQPAEIARILCLQSRPGDEPSCQGLQLPDPTAAMAYGMCLEYHRLDIRACKDLRLAYESELRAYLARPEPAPASPAASADKPPLTPGRARELHQSAAALYKATSTDAQTFAAALVIPEVRKKIETVFGQSLSSDRLRALAGQARAEALYWYSYMQGLERAPTY